VSGGWFRGTDQREEDEGEAGSEPERARAVPEVCRREHHGCRCDAKQEERAEENERDNPVAGKDRCIRKSADGSDGFVRENVVVERWQAVDAGRGDAVRLDHGSDRAVVEGIDVDGSIGQPVVEIEACVADVIDTEEREGAEEAHDGGVGPRLGGQTEFPQQVCEAEEGGGGGGCGQQWRGVAGDEMQKAEEAGESPARVSR
jgi:hypothetical protein